MHSRYLGRVTPPSHPALNMFHASRTKLELGKVSVFFFFS